ncbi:hypothetical protein [Paraburkholderia youngii]|uniref:hypothetical protein n=1 Tax=Paraburkholderia youngii TaxID=2782701 RepID=UPI003D1B7E8D
MGTIKRSHRQSICRLFRDQSPRSLVDDQSVTSLERPSFSHIDVHRKPSRLTNDDLFVIAITASLERWRIFCALTEALGMQQVKNGTSHDEDARDMTLATVQRWRIDSTSLNATVHLDADRFPASPVAPNQRGFVLDAEQARQMIRDLSAAVLALTQKPVRISAQP